MFKINFDIKRDKNGQNILGRSEAALGAKMFIYCTTHPPLSVREQWKKTQYHPGAQGNHCSTNCTILLK